MKYITSAGFVILLCVGAPLHGQSTAKERRVQWLNDLDEPLPLNETFEVCWIRGLDRHCEDIAGQSLPTELPIFDVLQIESPGHGPLSIKARDLQPTASGYQIKVPRKAWLVVKNRPENTPLNLSLYSQVDPSNPRPLVRFSPLTDETVRIPAGSFVASLSAKGSAPQLALIGPQPGERLTLTYQLRPGWSLLLRADEQQTDQPVSGADVALMPVPGYTQTANPDKGTRTSKTNESGLVVFNGLREPLMRASVEHPEFLPIHLQGLSATRGTFAFQDAPLPKGGSTTLSILLDDEPIPGADCALLKYERDTPGSQAAPRRVFAAKSDDTGKCHAKRLREGEYWLRIQPPERLTSGSANSAHVDRVVQVLEGQDSAVEIVFDPTRVTGTVRLGEQPAQGFKVVVQDPENTVENSSSKDALVAAPTDENGEFDFTLWTTGMYRVFVYNESGTPGAMKTLRVSGGEETVDFQLAADEIVGKVVDRDGAAVEGAGVQLKWNTFNHRLAISDPRGDFAFPVEGKGGIAEVVAHKEGYESSKPVEVTVGEGIRVEPLVLTLHRRPELRLRLITAGGAPVVGGWAASYRLEVREPILVGMASPGSEGVLRLPVVPGFAHRVFFSGPGCPLGARRVERVSDVEAILEIGCSPAPASLQVTLSAADGRPQEGLGLLLAKGDVVFPQRVVAAHLARLGLSAVTDGRGQLSLVALEPGEFRLYLANYTSPFNILVGAPNGFLATTSLEPWSTKVADVRIEVDSSH